MVFVIYHKMSQNLSESYIQITENFIRNNEPRSGYPAISYANLEVAAEYWEKINNLPVESYLQFGEASLGMVSYGYYKAHNEQIYIINAFCNEINSYYNVTQEFIKLLKNE